MNKLLKMTFMGVLALSLFACGKKKDTPTTVAPTTTAPAQKETIKILTPSGTPLMAIGGLIGTEGIKIDEAAPDLLAPELSKGNNDIIIAPLTAGAKLSIAGKSKYKLEAVVTTNNTYVIAKGNTTLTNISDLEGKKIVAYGQNNTPDIALRNAFKTNSLTFDDSLVAYQDSVTTAMAMFTAQGSEYDYCLIAEPQLSKMKSNGANIKSLDLSDYMSTTIYQAGIFVNPNSNQARCNEVIEEIKNNITYLNEHPADYATKVVDNDKEEGFFKKMGKEVLTLSIPNANISFIKAKDNKDNINAYFAEVNSFDTKILGGNVSDEFFR